MPRRRSGTSTRTLEARLVDVVQQEGPQHGVADHPVAVVGREDVLPLAAVVRAERTEELLELPERRVRTADAAPRDGRGRRSRASRGRRPAPTRPARGSPRHTSVERQRSRSTPVFVGRGSAAAEVSHVRPGRSSRASRSGSARMLISTIRPSRITGLNTDTGRPAGATSTPTDAVHQHQDLVEPGPPERGRTRRDLGGPAHDDRRACVGRRRRAASRRGPGSSGAPRSRPAGRPS